jgi:hypothetical protein
MHVTRAWHCLQMSCSDWCVTTECETQCSPTFNPSVCPVSFAITVERMDVEPIPKKPHPKNPSVKSMAPPAPRECNQPARSVLHRKQSAHRAAQRSALHRNQLAAHRSAHRIPCIATHYIASCAAQRTARMQPARAQRIASQTIRAPKTSPPRIARRAGFVWFVVLTFPKFNLYTLRIAILSCFHLF